MGYSYWDKRNFPYDIWIVAKGEASPQPEAHPCWRIGIFSRKFRESSAKERAKVKVHFEGGWPSKSCKNNAQSATNCLENGFHDAS